MKPSALFECNGLGRLPLSFELRVRPGEAGGERVRDVVVAGNDQQRRTERTQKAGGRVVLLRCASVAEVAAYDHELRHKPVDEWAQRQFCGRGLRRADVQIRNVQDACEHRRSRLYTRIVTDESTEIFDDLYLGLRAGGAVRKQRRGEPLTTEEQEALGRWQRLSTWRKSVAIGSFALGTFGLGVALGGLVFGRWRKAA